MPGTGQTQLGAHLPSPVSFPGHYSINVSLTQRSPNNVMSCFKSKTPREVKVDSCGPGPAAYSLRDLPKVAKKTCGL